MTGQKSNAADDERAWQAFPIIAAARDWSLRLAARITECLSDLGETQPELQTIVLTGSLARLDACSQSDCDLIVVLDDDVPLHGSPADNVMSAVWDRLEPLGLRRPQSRGVFVSPTSRRQLCDGPCGIVDEAVDVFGKRMQLLLEAQPVFGDRACRELQRNILLRYANHPFRDRPGEFWDYLTDDLVRYWRSYRVWRQWDISPGNGGWCLRNLKLRHSRLLSYAALLLACLADLNSARPVTRRMAFSGRRTSPENLASQSTARKSRSTDVESMLNLLAQTPLERLRTLEREYSTSAVDAMCRSYENYLSVVNDAAERTKLEQYQPPSAQEAVAGAPPRFTELLKNAEGIRESLQQLLRQVTDDHRGSAVVSLVF